MRWKDIIYLAHKTVFFYLRNARRKYLRWEFWKSMDITDYMSSSLSIVPSQSKSSYYDAFTGAFLYSIWVIWVIRITCVPSAFLEPAAPLSLNLSIPEEWPENYNFRRFHIFVIRHFPLFCVLTGLWFEFYTYCCCWCVAGVTSGVISSRQTIAAVHQSWQREHRCRQYKTKQSYQLNREKEYWWEGAEGPFIC